MGSSSSIAYLSVSSIGIDLVTYFVAKININVVTSSAPLVTVFLCPLFFLTTKARFTYADKRTPLFPRVSSSFSLSFSFETSSRGMANMFSFRRKPKKEPDSPRIRTSPSLPELNSQGIPWPEDLVDVNAIRQEPLSEAVPSQGAAKTSFQGDRPDIPTPFHKPFRLSTGKRYEGPISSLYMPPQSPILHTKAIPRSVGRYIQRRARTPPTFNIMVVMTCQLYLIADPLCV